MKYLAEFLHQYYFFLLYRGARIPCILVKGKAKDVSYDPGDDDIQEDNNWAIVYVAGSWRFVFPLWAFAKAGGHQKGNWMLLEDCGKNARERYFNSLFNECCT